MNACLVSLSKSCEMQQHDACRGAERRKDATPKWACSCSCHKSDCSVCLTEHGLEVLHASD